MPADGMSMWPPLFLWLTTTGRCWLGGLKLRSSEGIRVPRGWYAKIYEKFIFSGRLIDKFMENYAIIGGNRQLATKEEAC